MRRAAPGHTLLTRFDASARAWYIECTCDNDLHGPLKPDRIDAEDAMYAEQPRHFLINTRQEVEVLVNKITTYLKELNCKDPYVGYAFLGYMAFGIEVRFSSVADRDRANLAPAIDGVPIDIDIRIDSRPRFKPSRRIESLPPL